MTFFEVYLQPPLCVKPAFTQEILRWYRDNRRLLPWRKTREPYLIWLSEVILQQTRIAQGLPYYQKFVTRFPTIRHLARAPLRDVLRQWQGLGYYSRARNLHRCAKEIVSGCGGVFPKAYDQLLKLPGIGPYTAAAIGSICFDERRAVVDGNVFRVLARYFGLSHDIGSSAGQRVFSERANLLIPARDPGEYNQAVMEFGALCCVPRNPDCGSCPLSRSCKARRSGRQLELPVKRAKRALTSRFLYYLAADDGKRMLLQQRRPGDIWTGLYEFPLVEMNRKVSIATAMKHLTGRKVSGQRLRVSTFTHLLSHQRLYIHFIYLLSSGSESQTIRGRWPGCRVYTLPQADRLPKPVPLTRFLTSVQDLRKN
jgi:A/G-specific adenine glycosylase